MNVPATPTNKNSKVIYLSIATTVLLVLVVVGYLLITRFNVKVPFLSNVVNKATENEQVAEVEVPIYDEKTKKPNAKFFEMALEKDFEEVKAQTGGQITSPNLYQQDLREEFDKQLDRQIQNFSVTYTDNGFGPGVMTITQGDLVTFENTSSGNLKIIGDGWGSGLELNNKEINKFSQQFDLLGTYKYSAEGNSEHAGEVIVVKP
ncbi:MAG: hypothetical protein O2871_00535 [bacterium]|nr:hypothetical protein [bacterium]